MTGIRCTSTDLWTMAVTAWGEARNQGAEGLTAVLWVMRNRHDLHPRWKGMPLVAICRAPMQFSVWNPQDPNRRLLDQVSCDDAMFVQCLSLAASVLGGMGTSPVAAATHYFVTSSQMPVWAEGRTPVVIIGAHSFYENIP